MSSEARTGIVIVVVAALIIIGYAKLGGMARWAGRYQIVVAFTDLRGLETGAPVRLAGVKIGEVVGVEIEMPPTIPGCPAVARLSIDRRYTLFHGYAFQVASGSLMGDKYVSVTPGVRNQKAFSMQTAEYVAGGEPTGFEGLTDRAEGIADQAKESMANFNRLLSDAKLQQDVRDTLANLNVMSARAAELASKTLMMANTVGPQDTDKIRKLVDNLYDVSRTLRLTAAGLNALVATSPIPDNITQTTQNLRQTSASVEKTAAAVEQLLTDPKTSSDIRTTLENTRELTAQGTEAAAAATAALEKVDRIAGRVDRAMGGVSSLGHALRQIDYRGSLDVRLGSGESGRADLNIDLYPNPYRDSFWRVGVRDLGDHAGLNLQRGIPLHNRGEALRFGLVNGKVGLGWDREWSSRWFSETDLYDPGKVSFDARARYRYNPDWDVLFGVDSVFSDSGVFVGARRHFSF